MHSRRGFSRHPASAIYDFVYMHYNFNKDIVDGDEGEKRVAEVLCEKCDGIVSVTHNDDHKYDWKLDLDDGNSVTVEVKHDLEIGRTGNIALEVKCRGKESGVSVTQSDLFVVYCRINEVEHAYTFRTPFLKRIVKEWGTKKGGDIGKDGQQVSDLVLIPKLYLKKQYCDLFKMDRIDLRKFASECRKV